jgi:hypothetical protein
MTENRGAYRILVEKPEGKGPLERPRRRWEDNIKTDLAQDSDRWSAVANAVINLRVP